MSSPPNRRGVRSPGSPLRLNGRFRRLLPGRLAAQGAPTDPTRCATAAMCSSRHSSGGGGGTDGRGDTTQPPASAVAGSAGSAHSAGSGRSRPSNAQIAVAAASAHHFRAHHRCAHHRHAHRRRAHCSRRLHCRVLWPCSRLGFVRLFAFAPPRAVARRSLLCACGRTHEPSVVQYRTGSSYSCTSLRSYRLERVYSSLDPHYHIAIGHSSRGSYCSYRTTIGARQG